MYKLSACFAGVNRREGAGPWGLRACTERGLSAGREASCPSLIVGGWEREHGDVGLFGVRLRLGGSTAEGGPRHAEPPGR